MPQITVIVPVYKAEQYLEVCIRSILNQTFKDIEIILIDDGSPDKCPAICDEYAKKDQRIKVIHQKNAGVAVARNEGIRNANGEYITFVDSDDYLEPEMYNEMFKNAKAYDCDVVMCDCIKEFGETSSIYTHNIREGYYDRMQIKTEYFPQLLITPDIEYPALVSNVLCLYKNKKNVESRVYYAEGIRYSEDLLYGAQIMYQADSFYYMKGKCFYHYNCLNQLSATHTFVKDKWNDYQRLYSIIKQEFQNVQEYDFHEQISKVLLFFVYNAVGELIRSQNIDTIEKHNLVNSILRDAEVRKMFQHLHILKLPVHWKLKVLTGFYKYRIGIGFLCAKAK